MGFLVHMGAKIGCFHEPGSVTPATTNNRVFVSGQRVVTMADRFPVVGCPFTLPTTPPTNHPCIIIEWTVPASRVFVEGNPVILQDSTGICRSADQAPQGRAKVPATQRRVNGI
jgi:hypothetical protein